MCNVCSFSNSCVSCSNSSCASVGVSTLPRSVWWSVEVPTCYARNDPSLYGEFIELSAIYDPLSASYNVTAEFYGVTLFSMCIPGVVSNGAIIVRESDMSDMAEAAIGSVPPYLFSSNISSLSRSM